MNNKNDKCQYDLYKHWNLARSECGSVNTKETDFAHFKYCPYCGKEIIVVNIDKN